MSHTDTHRCKLMARLAASLSLLAQVVRIQKEKKKEKKKKGSGRSEEELFH